MEEKKDPWAEEFLERLDQMMLKLGERPVSEQARAEALGEEAANLLITSRQLVEEIAETRVVLRNTLALAMETEENEDYMHLTEIYSLGCNRLLGLLRAGRGDGDRLKNYVHEAIVTAIQEVSKELGLGERWKKTR